MATHIRMAGHPYQAAFLNRELIFFRTASSILINGGQARLKPSPGSFFVASMPRPEQSGLEPSAGGLRPDKTGKHPDSSGFEPYCAGCHPDRAGFIPDQSGLAPDDPGLYPDDSGFEPDRNGLRPETAGLSKNPCFCHFSSKLAATAGFRGILRGSRRDESTATAGHSARHGNCKSSGWKYCRLPNC